MNRNAADTHKVVATTAAGTIWTNKDSATQTTVYRGTTRLGTMTKRYNTWEARSCGVSTFHKTKAAAFAHLAAS